MAISAKTITVKMTLDTSGFDRGIAGVNTKLNNLETTGSGVASSLKGAFAAIVGAATIDQFIQMADAITGLQNKLQVVVGSQQAANDAFNQITGIASRTRSSLTDVGDLYSKVALAGEQLGLSQGQVAQTTETFTKALKLTGASGAQASAAILQFGQALASGRVQGDEFRSLMENAPAFMRKLSEALGVSQGDLRKLATEGALTADVVIAATQQMSASVDEDFGKTIPTISDAFENLRNNIMLMFIEMNEATGIFEVIRQGINLLANNIGVAFKFIGAMIAFALGAKAVALIFNFIKALQALRTATKAQTVAQIALLAFGGPAGLAALAAGAAAAAAAYIALDAAIPDRFDIPNLETSDLGSAPDARAMLEASKARAQAQKDAARATRTAAREAASEARRVARERQRELDTVEDLILAIDNQTGAVRRKITADLESIGLSDRQRELADQIRAIDEKRRDDIVKIQQLQRLSAAEQQTAINEINDKYAEQTAEITKGNEALYRRKSVIDEIRAVNEGRADIRRSYDIEIDGIEAIAEARRQGNDEAVRNEEERQAVFRKFGDQRWELTKQINASTDALEKERLSSQGSNLIYLEGLELQSLGKLQAKRKEILEEQKTFGFGLSEAMKKFGEEVNNQAAYAERLFNTMAQGFTDAILTFVQTGKLSFKDLFRSLMLEIIKMQVNKLFLSIFGKGGPLGTLFAGFFANGGMIPGGKYGIAGEAGPELIRGPAHVVSTKDTAAILGSGGSAPSITQVTYNINAVDSMSFKQMLARDPEFLFNATRAGARRVPR
jgi:tape measure domain-containing protein